MTKEGKCLIFSAPSGSGKTTIVQHVVASRQDVAFSISATTRPPRQSEEDGKDYYFLSRSDFEKKLENNEFLEWEEVYEGHYYGTLKSEVSRIHSNNQHVIFDVDVAGGANLKGQFQDLALAVFIKVNDIEELKKRLLNRGTETAESLDIRLRKSREELAFEKYFDKIIVNDQLDITLDEADKVVSDYLGDHK